MSSSSSPAPSFTDDVPANPWILTSERVRATNFSPKKPAVLLVLGAPSAQDLLPLLHSQFLSSSLLILAVHQPPLIPSSALPAVRIIRLPAPLEIENAGAVRLVSALERAERVARIWRKNRVTGVVELPENDDGATLHIDSPPTPRHSYGKNSDAPPSPASSSEHLNPPQNRWSKVSISSKSLSKLLSGGLPPVDPTQRPFDALFNYLPADVADKSLLKQAILVTTISHPFLSAVAAPSTTRSSSRADSSENRHRWSASMFRGWNRSIPTPPPSVEQSLSSTPTLADLPADKAHLVHLLPLSPRHYHKSTNSGSNLGLGRSKFIQSLESFLQSFAYPARQYIPTVADSTATDRAVPYFLPASTLGTSIQYAPTTDEHQTPPVCAVADLLLRGLLDPPSPAAGAAARQKQRADTSPPRVWIGGSQDVLVLGSHWSSGNGAGLAKLSLAARPGLGLGMAPRPRSRVVTGRVALSSAMGPRSASAPNVAKLGRPIGPKHKSSLPDSLDSRGCMISTTTAATSASIPKDDDATSPFADPPALTRAETETIVSVFRKPLRSLTPPPGMAAVTARSRLSFGGQEKAHSMHGDSQRVFRLYDQSSLDGSDNDKDAAGVITPPDSEESAASGIGGGDAGGAAVVPAVVSTQRQEAAVVVVAPGSSSSSSNMKMTARPAFRSGANSVYGSLRKSISYLGTKAASVTVSAVGEEGGGGGPGGAGVDGNVNGGRRRGKWYFWRGSRMTDPWVTSTVGV